MLFRASTGDAIRIAAPRFEHLRSSAPRAVFVGLSHACNLQCWFCSRDAGIRERWTAGDMVRLLTQLADAGTMEVAFGGGEPLAYAGFAELIERIATTTPLAVHFTTNGTLVDATIAERLAPFVGEVRVSIYEATDWTTAVRHLRSAGIQVGANVVVTRHNVGGIAPLLHTLRELGCANVALLRYVGDDDEGHLQGSDWLALEHAIRTAPLTVRLSRCFADRMPTIPRFRWSQDCGAGRDFLVIDPDSHIRACSYHPTRAGFTDAAQLLRLVQAGHELGFDSPSPSRGCARPLHGKGGPAVHFLRGFASNNSGDTVLVARFETEHEPSELAERLAGLDPETDRDAWERFLLAEDCAPGSSHYEPAVAAVGRTLLATGYDADDALHGLREVVTRRGARVVHTEVHAHESPMLLAGIAADSRSAPSVETSLWSAGADEVERHGGALYAAFSTENTDWQHRIEQAQEAASGAPVAAELLSGHLGQRLVDGAKALVDDGEPGYFQGWFYQPERAKAFADSAGHALAQAGSTVVIPVTRFRKRLAIRAHASGGVGCWLPKGPLRLRAAFYYRDYRKGDLPLGRVQSAVHSASGVPTPFELAKAHRAIVAKTVVENPLPVLEEIERIAHALDVAVSVNAAPATPMANALGRLKRELRVLR